MRKSTKSIISSMIIFMLSSTNFAFASSNQVSGDFVEVNYSFKNLVAVDNVDNRVTDFQEKDILLSVSYKLNGAAHTKDILSYDDYAYIRELSDDTLLSVKVQRDHMVENINTTVYNLRSFVWSESYTSMYVISDYDSDTQTFNVRADLKGLDHNIKNMQIQKVDTPSFVRHSNNEHTIYCSSSTEETITPTQINGTGFSGKFDSTCAVSTTDLTSLNNIKKDKLYILIKNDSKSGVTPIEVELSYNDDMPTIKIVDKEFKNRFIKKFSMISNIEGAPIINNGEYIGVINSIEKNIKDGSSPIAYVHIFDQLY